MEETQYKNFSLKTHKKNWKARNLNVCQFELTFKCGLHCRHCYSDCYNKPSLVKKELNTSQVKTLIDKVFDLGVLWFCFTGGDPLERPDFLELYAYAKEKGFIVTVFTSGISLTKEIVKVFTKTPPFVIEMTLNGATKETYETVTRVRGSFEKAMRGLELMLKYNLPLKVKTMATKQNFKELLEIKEFLDERNIMFRPSSLLHARLNGDKGPCDLRLSKDEINEIDKMFGVKSSKEDENHKTKQAKNKPLPKSNNRLFRCAFGSSDGINIDPYGNMFPCSCIRKPVVNFLNSSPRKIKEAIFKTYPAMAHAEFETDSKCRSCSYIDICPKCPGKALLETGDMEARINDFCKLIGKD